jgi:hypothetical protein
MCARGIPVWNVLQMATNIGDVDTVITNGVARRAADF